jgi:hypothetical protein
MRSFFALMGVAFFTLPVPGWAEHSPPDWPTLYGGRDPSLELEDAERRALKSLDAAMTAAGSSACRLSGRLTTAARAHARYLLESTKGPGRVDPLLVRAEVLRAGAVDPAVVPWAVSFTGEPSLGERLDRFARSLKGRPLSHCGAGIVRGKTRKVLVVLGTRRRVTLETFPSRLVPGDRHRLVGLLDLGYNHPSVLVTRPEGDITEVTAPSSGHRFSAWIDFPTAGRYAVEVMAEGARGPEVVALFPVFVGARPEELAEHPGRDDEGTADPVEAEAIIFRLLNEERRRAGLPPLVRDREIARLANQHSADMLDRGYFGHISPSGRDVVERLGRAGFVVLRAAENLARSSSPRRAHRSLMDSPSHRANILDPDLTHVGLGVARRRGEIVVTQIFVAW